MMAKFAEAFRLLWRHLRLFTGIILTVWLPGNILFYWEAISEEKGTDDAAPNGGPALAVAGVGAPDGPASATS
jgi:hypothetical protein